MKWHPWKDLERVLYLVLTMGLVKLAQARSTSLHGGMMVGYKAIPCANSECRRMWATLLEAGRGEQTWTKKRGADLELKFEMQKLLASWPEASSFSTTSLSHPVS